MLNRISKNIDLVISHVCSLLLLAIAVLVSIEVILRYVAHVPLAWAEETIILILVYLGFLGSALAEKDNAQIRVESLVERLPAMVQRWMGLIVKTIVLIYLLFVVIITIKNIPLQSITRTPILGISNGWYVVSLGLGAICSVVFLLSIRPRQNG